MKIDLPLKEGCLGKWKLEKFYVSKDEANLFNKRQCLNGRKRFIEPGAYWRLQYHDTVVMSNTPAEIDDHIRFIEKAQGRVLIAGLGLGMVMFQLLKKETVTEVLVVEKSEDVIKLIAPFYKSDKLRIIHADIFDFKTSEKFDFAWFDIWSTISEENYDKMLKLHKKFARTVKYRDSWCKKECRRLNKNSNN